MTPQWRQIMRVAMMKELLLVFPLSLLVSVAFSQQPAPDLILLKGKVFTSSASHSYVEALAIRGERIVAAGTSSEIAALAGKETKRIDLGSRVIIPGINDAHYHMGVAPATYDLPIQENDPLWQEIKDALSSAVAKVPKGTWIEAAFGANILDDPQATRTALDLLAPDNPVALWDWTGHASLLNTLGLKKLGIRENELNPEGGMYARNQADGKLTGMVFEFAQFRAGRRFSELASEQQAEQQLHKFFNQAARWGITTVQNMSNPIAAERCVALFEKAPPPVRVRVMWFGLTDEKQSLLALLAMVNGGGSDRYWTDTEVYRSKRGTQALSEAFEAALRGRGVSVNFQSPVVGVDASGRKVELHIKRTTKHTERTKFDDVILAIPPSTWKTIPRR